MFQIRSTCDEIDIRRGNFMKITSRQLRKIISEEISRYMEDQEEGYRPGISFMEDEGDYGLMGAVDEEDEGSHYGLYEDEEDYVPDLEEMHDNDQKRMNQPGGDEDRYLKHRVKGELSERLRRRR